MDDRQATRSRLRTRVFRASSRTIGIAAIAAAFGFLIILIIWPALPAVPFAPGRPLQ